MKSFIFYLLFAVQITFASCSSSAVYTDERNPCNETGFMILKSRPDSVLSESERGYVIEKQLECDEFMKQSERSKAKASADKTFIIILVSIAAVTGLLLLLASQMGTGHGHW